jgi:hypothetical protein
MIEFVAGLAAFLLVLAFLGAIADSVDRRDARRRNAQRRMR